MAHGRAAWNLGVMIKIKPIAALLIACFIWTADAPASEHVPALIDKGVRLLKAGDYTDAFNLFNTIDAGSNEWLKARATYMAGYALLKSGRDQEALETLSSITDNILVGDYALAHIARIQSNKENYEQVVETTAQIRERFPSSPVLRETAMIEAEALVKTGKRDKAVKHLQRYIKSKPEDGHKPLWMLARLLEDAGRLDEAYKTYQRIFYRHPQTDLAEPARGETVRLYNEHRGKFRTGEPSKKLKRVKTLIKERQYESAELYIRTIDMSKLDKEMQAKMLIQRARALDKMNRDEKAIKIYRRVIEKFSETKSRPRAIYSLARLQWNLGNGKIAMNLMDTLSAEYPKHKRAPTALYVSGKIDDKNGNRERAISKWMRVVEEYPKSDIAPTCLWNVGWSRYRQGNYIKAQNAFSLFAEKYPDSDELKKALYWHGRAIIDSGDRVEKIEQFETLMEKFPNSYYTILAESMDNSLYTQMIRFYPNEDMLDEILESNIVVAVKKYQKKPELDPIQQWALYSSRNWVSLGFKERAKPLLDMIADGMDSKNGHLIWLGYQYFRAGLYSDMFWRLDMVMAKKNVDDNQKQFLMNVMYPVPHWKTIRSEAEKYNVDPMLVLAIMRQESRFDAEVVSRANARGLMQIIPPTGKRISKQLSMNDYTDELLHDPQVNIRMGVYYLSTLLRRTGGELAPALASYNAGMSVVNKWLKRLPYDDVSEFIETIPYPETRGYVKNVLRNYGVYQDIYYKTLRTEFAQVN
ncbi:MAG: tetratricopeptide repeat protein [Nitrospinota bacterium]